MERGKQGTQQRREGVWEGKRRERRRNASSLCPSINLRFPFRQQKTVCTIAAHEGALAAIAFNASGSRLASASEKVSSSGARLLPAWWWRVPGALGPKELAEGAR